MIQPVGSKIPLEIRGLNLTNIERQLLEIISDGKGHNLESLKRYDPYVEDGALIGSIHRLRKKVIDSQYRVHSGHEKGHLLYRLVRLL